MSIIKYQAKESHPDSQLQQQSRHSDDACWHPPRGGVHKRSTNDNTCLTLCDRGICGASSRGQYVSRRTAACASLPKQQARTCSALRKRSPASARWGIPATPPVHKKQDDEQHESVDFITPSPDKRKNEDVETRTGYSPRTPPSDCKAVNSTLCLLPLLHLRVVILLYQLRESRRGRRHGIRFGRFAVEGWCRWGVPCSFFDVLALALIGRGRDKVHAPVLFIILFFGDRRRGGKTHLSLAEDLFRSAVRLWACCWRHSRRQAEKMGGEAKAAQIASLANPPVGSKAAQNNTLSHHPSYRPSTLFVRIPAQQKHSARNVARDARSHTDSIILPSDC